MTPRRAITKWTWARVMSAYGFACAKCKELKDYARQIVRRAPPDEAGHLAAKRTIEANAIMEAAQYLAALRAQEAGR